MSISRVCRYLLATACLSLVWSPDVNGNGQVPKDPFGGKLKVLWARQLWKGAAGTDVAMTVTPFEDNYFVSVVAGPKEPQDAVTEYVNVLVDQGGTEIWRRNYQGPDFQLRPGELFEAGSRLYGYLDMLENEKGKSKRYHIWFDRDGYLEAISAMRFDPATYQSAWASVEMGTKAFTYTADCGEDSCWIDRAAADEKGEYAEKKERVHTWSFPPEAKSKAPYRVYQSDGTFLLVKGSKNKGLDQEYRLLIFKEGSAQPVIEQSIIVSDGYTNQTIRDGNGFLSISTGKSQCIVVALDGQGKERARAPVDLPYQLTSPRIRPYHDGLLLTGSTKAGTRQSLALMKLSRDGRLQWHLELNTQGGERMLFLGSHGKYIFFCQRGTLYVCEEKQP